jgi:hypothetical protein
MNDAQRLALRNIARINGVTVESAPAPAPFVTEILTEDDAPVVPKRNNHINNLTTSVAELRAVITAVRKDITNFKSYLSGSKFTGSEDGERKDWISTGDVMRWLSDIDSSLQS